MSRAALGRRANLLERRLGATPGFTRQVRHRREDAAGDYVALDLRVERPVQELTHCMAMVTVLDVNPTIWIATGTASPLEAPAGTTTSSWYSPTAPGARPENRTVAAAPPIVTFGVATVRESGSFSPGDPVAGWLLTKPKPVQ